MRVWLAVLAGGVLWILLAGSCHREGCPGQITHQSLPPLEMESGVSAQVQQNVSHSTIQGS